jgi:hypothetical protein
VERAPARQAAAPKAPAVNLAKLEDAVIEQAKGGTAALTAYWKGLGADERSALSANPDLLKNAKTVAAAADAVAATVENNDE